MMARDETRRRTSIARNDTKSSLKEQFRHLLRNKNTNTSDFQQPAKEVEAKLTERQMYLLEEYLEFVKVYSGGSHD